MLTRKLGLHLAEAGLCSYRPEPTSQPEAKEYRRLTDQPWCTMCGAQLEPGEGEVCSLSCEAALEMMTMGSSVPAAWEDRSLPERK